MLAGLHKRADVQAEFPRLDAGDLGRFLDWAAIAEDPDLALSSDLRPAPRPLGAPVGAAVAPWGVNVVGYFRSELGMGEAARQVISALDAAGVPVLPIPAARFRRTGRDTPSLSWNPGTRPFR